MGKPIIIGVAGGTGAGKTAVVNTIIEKMDHRNVASIQHDYYYRDRSHLPASEREKINYDHPDALETELLIRHLMELSAGQKVEIPVYDFTTHTRRKERTSVLPEKIIIVDGILLFTDKDLREMMDVKIFIDTDDDIRFIRRLERDIKWRNRSMESVIKQYLETARPMQIEFVGDSKKYADIIIPEGNNPVAINMVVSMLKNTLNAGEIKCP